MWMPLLILFSWLLWYLHVFLNECIVSGGTLLHAWPTLLHAPASFYGELIYKQKWKIIIQSLQPWQSWCSGVIVEFFEDSPHCIISITLKNMKVHHFYTKSTSTRTLWANVWMFSSSRKAKSTNFVKNEKTSVDLNIVFLILFI